MSETEEQVYVHPAVLERVAAEQQAGRARLEELAAGAPPLAESGPEGGTTEEDVTEDVTEDEAQLSMPLSDEQIASAEAEFRRASAPAASFVARQPAPAVKKAAAEDGLEDLI
jgi:hypothetical protein